MRKTSKIVKVSIYDTVEILGHKVEGLKAIMDAVEIVTTKALIDILPDGRKMVWDRPRPTVRLPKPRIPGLHVLEVYEDYPCFDSSDYLYENRYYRNYFFSEKSFTPEEIREITEIRRKGNLEFFDRELPEIAIPSAYYVGQGETMEYAF